MMELSDNICAWTPGIEPVEKGGKIQPGLIRGIATSERHDVVRERLSRDGADPSPFLGSISKGGDEADSGGIAFEHPTGVFNLVGEPLDLEKGISPSGFPCYYLTSKLWLDDEPIAKSLWDKVLRLQRASKRVRLGYSVEGKALERDKDDRKFITRWAWTNTVITGAPKNRDAWFEPIFASLNATPEGRDLIRKAMESMPSVRDFATEMGMAGEAAATADGVDIEAALRLGRLAEKLGFSPVDLAVAKALKGSASWTTVLAQLMRRVAATMGS